MGMGPSLVSLAPGTRCSLLSCNAIPLGELHDETKNSRMRVGGRLSHHCTIATHRTLRVLRFPRVFISWLIRRLFDFCAASFCSGNFRWT